MISPKALGLPYREYRPGQRLAVRTAQFAKTTHVMINAPTGAGKSAIAAMLPLLNPEMRHVLLTATKGLQDAYGLTYPWLTDLRGMSNYPCLAARDQFKDWFPVRRLRVACDDGPCHEGAACTRRESGCEYFDARRAFVNSQAGLTNFAAWLSNRRYGEGLGPAKRLVIDEAHALPEQLMAAYRLEISAHLLDARPPTTRKGWRSWAAQCLEDLRPSSDDDNRAKRQRTEDSLKQLTRINSRWAWEFDEANGQFVFEPVVPRLLLPLLHTFDRESTIVYLSATVTPRMLHMLGVDDEDITYFELKSRFPVGRRPIYLRPVVRMDYRTMQRPETLDQMVEAMDDLIEDRQDRRGLILTTSFSLGYDILKRSRFADRILMHPRGAPIARVVEDFRSPMSKPILMSPSIWEGYNFPMQEAEFTLIPKLPFPDTRSAIMRARCKATPDYRDSYTMRRLVQGCGRINRGDWDSGETFVLDGHAGWFIDKAEAYAPSSFLDAIVRVRRSVRPLPKLLA